MHDYFAFLIKTKKNIELKQAFELMIFFGYQIKYYRGFHLNVEFLIRTMVDKYGQESVINICEAHIQKIIWQEEEKQEMKKALEKIKSENSAQKQT